MKNEEKYVDPATIDVKNPIFERLEEDKNNPWVLEEQIKYYKSLGVPIAHYAFPGQKERHYYAVFEGSSKLYADDFNRMNNRDAKKRERHDNAIKENEPESYEVMVENGYDAISDEDSPEDIVIYMLMLDVLLKEYNDLSDDKKSLCDTISKGMTQRKAAEELGISRRTYRDRKEALMKDLVKKFKDYK